MGALPFQKQSTMNKFQLRFTRYLAVGIILNLIFYLLYLTLTFIGLEPKITSCTLFLIALTASYIGHNNFTFKDYLISSRSFIKYLFIQLSCLTFSLTMLFLFSDLLGFPHQVIQLTNIVLLAPSNFFLMRKYVFKANVQGQNLFY